MIKSSLQTAEEIATNMGRASDSIQQATHTTLSIDSQTTLTVNSKAQESNQQALDLASQYNEAFLKAIQNIQSAAEEFQRKDDEMKVEIGQSLNIPNYIEDMRTYQKAKNG